MLACPITLLLFSHLEYSHGIVPVISKHSRELLRQVLVNLELHAALLDENETSLSRVSSAAYAMTALMSSTVTDG
jgi:hypothetical protein